MTVADHMFYFPMVGILGVIGISLQNIKHRPKYIKWIGITFAIIVSILLSVRTVIRNMDWSSGISLYSHDLQYQQNDLLENNLASELVVKVPVQYTLPSK